MDVGCKKLFARLSVLTIAMMGQACSMGGGSSKDLLQKFPTPIYSLTGEQLNSGPLSQTKCEDAQKLWLERVDTDHDGSIDLDELLAEANRQFILMDINHDGAVTADELYHYRSQQLEPAAAHEDPEEEKEMAKKSNRGVHRLALHPPGSQPDPVLSADLNLDFQVTLDEYLASQKDNLQSFDSNHDHKLDSQDLAKLCRIREQAANPSRK